MTQGQVDQLECAFTAQRHTFLELVNARFPCAPKVVEQVMATAPRPAPSVIIDDLAEPSEDDIAAVNARLKSGCGIVHVVPRRFQLQGKGERHPLLGFAARLTAAGVIGHPVEHPMEGHPEAVARFGMPDGTLKLYDLSVVDGVDKYREQAETNERFDSHNDGLGYAGLIRHVIMTLDRPPMAGGYTYFQNLVSCAPALANSDPEAFQALFLPDAITALRPRGKGAIRVSSPVFFIGRGGEPQVFFRMASGEYQIEWRDGEALMRARAVLERLCAPFGPGSRFVHASRPGDTMVVDNWQVVHGRTPFVDSMGGGRVLARKWFVSSMEEAAYRHVPSIALHRAWASVFPGRFDGSVIEGEWHYDAGLQKNVRIR